MWKKESNVGVQRIGSRLTGGGTDSTCAKLCAWLSRKLPSSSPKCFHHFHLPRIYTGSSCFTALPTLGIVLYSLSRGWEMVSLCDFHSISLVLVLEISHVFHGHSGFLLWSVFSSLSPILRMRLFVFVLWMCQLFIYSWHMSFVRWQIYFLRLGHAYSFAEWYLNSIFLGPCLYSLKLRNSCLTEIKLIRMVLL